jgi:hypothetical protein
MGLYLGCQSMSFSKYCCRHCCQDIDVMYEYTVRLCQASCFEIFFWVSMMLRVTLHAWQSIFSHISLIIMSDNYLAAILVQKRLRHLAAYIHIENHQTKPCHGVLHAPKTANLGSTGGMCTIRTTVVFAGRVNGCSGATTPS